LCHAIDCERFRGRAGVAAGVPVVEIARPYPMPSTFASVHRYSRYGRRLLCAAALLAGWQGAAQAQEARPSAAVLLDRLCAETLRPNEEDRLFGLISITVRATIKYQGGMFDPDLIDDSVQDALGAITAACPQFAKTDDAHRLGKAVELARDATSKRLQDGRAGYDGRQIDKATAADLSEELSAQEIDAWLDGLPAKQRAIALLLYASHLTQQEMASAVGLPPPGLAAGFRGVKTDLLKFFRAESDSAPAAPASAPRPPASTMEYRVAGQPLAALLTPDPRKADGQKPASVRITGISSDVYAGWSLLATVIGLPPERGLEISEPLLVEPDGPGRRRMIVVASDEISDPPDNPRRFLLKAFAIDANKEGAALRDTFHLGATAIDNPQAQQTLRHRGLAAIEIARCLWYDYGTSDDPGFCR
jgi:DNA-directed RNA polymerase specialized sigma24 family protein